MLVNSLLEKVYLDNYLETPLRSNFRCLVLYIYKECVINSLLKVIRFGHKFTSRHKCQFVVVWSREYFLTEMGI
jgi:hypothetical protein